MKIAASVLDCKNRINGVLELNKTNVSYIHIDVMDGKFVSNVQFGSIDEIKDINMITKYPMDVHLMIDNPSDYIKELGDMHIEFITIHLEIDKDKRNVFKEIRNLGYKVGLSIKPNTIVSEIEPFLDDIDLILVMSVEPGIGGQRFIESTIDRVKELKKLINKSNRNILIEVDGGINNETIQKLDNVDIAVVGSYIVKSNNYSERVKELLDLVNFKVINNKSMIHNILVNGFISVGTILILLAAVLETTNSDVFSSLWEHSFLFLVGFFSLAGGLFNKDIRNKDIKELKKLTLLYRLLLIVSLVSIVLLVVYSLITIGKLEFWWLFLFAIIFSEWHVWLLILLFVSISLVRLNEIKRLSGK